MQEGKRKRGRKVGRCVVNLRRCLIDLLHTNMHNIHNFILLIFKISSLLSLKLFVQHILKDGSMSYYRVPSFTNFF